MSIKALQEWIRISKYARYNPEKSRRETWSEQIDRVFDMHLSHLGDKANDIKDELNLTKKHMIEKRIVGSQRNLQFGGSPVLKHNEKSYNCCATYIDRIRAFQEILFLLINGCGVGIHVGKHHVNKLPNISARMSDKIEYIVEDNIEGWADAIGVLMSSYFNTPTLIENKFQRKIIEFNFDKIRPEGSKISWGAKAPGPLPLKNAIKKIEQIFENCIENNFSKLRTIDAYDIVMHISDAAISGGVRRSAVICLFDVDDELMIKAKTNDWFINNPHRARSNNSALVNRNTVSKEQYLNLMKSVKEFGEPGVIFTDNETETLFNPCCEINLRAYDDEGNSGIQFCNLSEINIKKCKTENDFYEACKTSAIIGTIQASYTSFPYLGIVTENITKREALIGVSMTGIMDNPDISLNPEILQKGAEIVKNVNKFISEKIGINPAARCTAVKPSGNTSALLGVANGVHPHHSKRYFRRVQVNKKENPLQFFKLFNPSAVEESVWSANKTDEVITFTCEVPTSARVKNNVNAVELLKNVKLVQKYWVTNGKNVELCVKDWLNHNVSNTINCNEDEWDEVFEYIFENKEYFTGISLLPSTGDKDYQQAPFQTVFDPKELVEMYGDASVFASGLIIHAQQAFDGSLYNACDSFMGFGEKLTIPEIKDDATIASVDKLKKLIDKKLWVERAKKFTNNYFNGDRKRMVNALKDVDAWKKWCDLKREYSEVPWDEFLESEDNTKIMETVACAGGSCAIL